MEEPAADPTLTTPEPVGRPTSTFELWTPRGIGWASVLLGFPGATVLAAMNWRRMGRTRKAIVHLVSAVIATWALVFVNTSVALLIGVVVGYYLYATQRRDQANFASTERSGVAGAAIAIVATFLIVGSGVLVEMAAPTSEAQARGNVQAGIDLSDEGQLERAIDAYTKAIELDPTLAVAFVNRGTAYLQQGKYDRALVDLTQAIELDPTLAVAFINRGNAHIYMGNYDLAIADATKAIELDPTKARGFGNRGNANVRLAKPDLAIVDLTKAIELDPTLGELFANRGNAYIQQGKYDLAIVDLTKAIQLEPTDPFAPALRGFARAATGDVAAATADFDRALSLTTDADLTSRIKKLRCDVGLECE